MQRFPSIKKNTEFRRIYKEGRKKSFRSILMFTDNNGLDHNRIGISISHREGNSVVRHTFTRRMREIFRIYDKQSVQGKDIIVVARNRAGSLSFDELKEEYRQLLSLHKLI
ncbi:MAG: ribonuclease P protein component [Eubacteriales bacterium]|nr:ribonuclease P protein component [Eubacteriales bacterium]